MHVLVLGANGMAGHMVSQYMNENGHKADGFARSECLACKKSYVGDATDNSLIRQIILSNKYDAVINCIGVLNSAVDMNPIDGIYLNAGFPHMLAKICADAGCRFITLSTDCVYTGKKGEYVESDIPDETTYYGKSKFLGEVLGENCLTIRTSIVGPEIKSNGVGLFHWFMNQKERVGGYTNALWSGVTTLELAKAMLCFLEQKIEGLYFLTNSEKISKFELLKLFNRYCRNQQVEIYEVDKPVHDKTLICTRKDFCYTVPSYEDMVSELSDWMIKHGNIYKQYEELIG